MFFDHMSLNITFPILTLLFFDAQSSFFSANASHAVRSLWYGLCVAVPHIVNIFATPLLSALSDEFGRKRILLIGTLGAFLFAITAGLGILWGMLSLLFLGRIIQGAFSRTTPIAQAVIGDLVPREKKVLYMGYLQTAISLGAFLGPIIGGYFAKEWFFASLNFSLPYFIAAFFAGLSCILTFIFFHETLIVKRHIKPWSEFNAATIKKVLANPNVLKISSILLLSQISWSIYYQFIPPILKTELGFTAHQLGLFVGIIAFWLAVATGVGIRILDYFFSMKQMLFFSLYLVLIGLTLTFLFCYWHTPGHTTLFIWLAAIPTAVGDVIAFSCITTLYSDAVDPQEQGKVMGVCFIVVALIWAFTGVIGGFLMSLYELLPLLVAPLGILLSIFLLHSKFSHPFLTR